MRRISIFDTTLRDGEQSPGVSLIPAEKLEIARQLERLGVDVIEAGFPITSDGDFEAVQEISRAVRTPVIAALARTSEADITRAAQALEGAAQPRIHVFTSSSSVHLTHMLRKSEDEVVEASTKAIRLARRYVDQVEFSGQDAMRSDPVFLYRLLEAAIAAGATVVNIPDTVGYTTPEEFGDLIRSIRAHVPEIERVQISVHCHNDLGLATANTLAGLAAGASQAEVTVNGIGERAGNTSLEEVVMAIATRADHFGLETKVRTQAIAETSQLVTRLSGMPVQPNKAIVGRNAFWHEAGIHQDGVLKERTTYEIMRAEDVGLDSNALVLGKHSGRHAFRVRLEALGYDLSPKEVKSLFKRFKDLADRKKSVTDADVQALVEDQVFQGEETFALAAFHVSSSGNGLATATVSMLPKGGQQVTEAAVGNGPVEALCRAIQRATQVEGEIEHYTLRSVGEGTDAQGEVYCQVRAGGRTFIGHGVSTDILEASAKAYTAALNKAAQLIPAPRVSTLKE